MVGEASPGCFALVTLSDLWFILSIYPLPHIPFGFALRFLCSLVHIALLLSIHYHL